MAIDNDSGTANVNADGTNKHNSNAASSINGDNANDCGDGNRLRS